MSTERRILSTMFDDIAEFHLKYLLIPFPSFEETPADYVKFRENFLVEEASETFQALAARKSADALDGLVDLAYIAIGTLYTAYPTSLIDTTCETKPLGLLNIYITSCGIELKADSAQLMYELARACRTTAINLNWDFDAAWMRVHAANMKKIRVERAADSKRGSGYDVVKPEGWTAPVLTDLVN